MDFLEGLGLGEGSGFGDSLGGGSDAASSIGGGGISDYFSGALQASGSLLTGYLSKLADVDIARRVQGMQPQPNLGTTQNGVLIRAGAPQAGGVKVGQGQTLLNLNALLPYMLVGAAVFFIAKRAG